MRPSTNSDVTITLPSGSVSTESGRPLSNSPSARVIGPVGMLTGDGPVETRIVVGPDGTAQLRGDVSCRHGDAPAGVRAGAGESLGRSRGPSAGRRRPRLKRRDSTWTRPLPRHVVRRASGSSRARHRS